MREGALGGEGPRVVAVDAVGISAGGGREVVRDVVLACERHPGLPQIVVFLSDAELAGELRDRSSVDVIEVPGGLAWRAWWWVAGCDRACRRAGAGGSLHLANIALRRRPHRKGVLVHQPNAIEAGSGLRLHWRARVRYRILRFLIKRTCQTVDQVFVQSAHVRDRLAELADPRTPITIAPPGPPSSLPPPSPLLVGAEPDRQGHVKRFAYIGSNAAHKNVSVLYRAAPRLADAFPRALFALTLEPPDCITTSTPSLEFLGPQDRRGIADLLASSVALVMPSFTETVGLPMLEAMSFGVPVIAADRPYAHAICGDAAVYFDPGDPESLVQVCERVADDQSTRSHLIGAGRDRIRALQRDRGDRKMANWLARAGGGRDS